MLTILRSSDIWILSFCHVFLLTMSNVLVQYPFSLFGYPTTWGAFTYPLIFILTDLTTQIVSAKKARSIIFRSMLPGLIGSYLVASWIEMPGCLTWSIITTIHYMPLRIAFACFMAYGIGQLFDVFIFQKFRSNSSWWLAPVLSTTAGNLLDTLIFFSIAFYGCNNLFLSQHWPEIAMIDLFFKITISLIAFIPLYGVILNAFRRKYLTKTIISL